MAKRIRHAAHEFVPAQWVDRTTRKGRMELDFNIGGTWFRWRKNVPTERGVFRFGVRDWDGSIQRSLEV